MIENDIPNPNDDLSEKAKDTIDFMIKNYEWQLIYLIKQLNYPDTPNSYRRVLEFCVKIKRDFIDPMGSKLTNDENLDECIKQMNRVSEKSSPQDKIHFMSLANEIGSIYLQVYVSL